MIDIENQNFPIRILIVAISLFIGSGSLYYTNILVKEIEEREHKQIDLFAKGQEFVTSANDNLQSLNFLFTEIVGANNSIPVIWADADGNPLDSRNIEFPENITDEEKTKLLAKRIISMQAIHDPIPVELAPGWQNYIYYENSALISKLKYYPYVQLSVIAIFAIFIFIIFNTSKRSEQNRVWVGLAKETAHQLGTPISSLMAWLEYFKSEEDLDKDIIHEIEKDIERLTMITSRFSNIGSVPSLKPEPIIPTINSIVNYLQKRISTKVTFEINFENEPELITYINIPLFEWIIENLCKNAVDAMSGAGKITITVYKVHKKINIEIADTGKGIPKNQIKKVFLPGFTTKKRGWGLGLTLVKRIVENYHKGKISVKQSEINVGTTFLIQLPIAT